MRIAKDDLAFLLGVFLSFGYVAIWLGIRKLDFLLVTVRSYPY